MRVCRSGIAPLLFTPILLLAAARPASAQCDLSPVFAAPTDAEFAEVESVWTARDPHAIDWTVEAEGLVGGFRTMVVSHTVEGDTTYAAIRFPQIPSSCPYPVLMYTHGGAFGTSLVRIVELEDFLPGSLLDDSLLVLLPSFRGEELDAGPLGTYLSGGSTDQHDGDADDAIALLDGVLAHIPEADPHRVMVWGKSRGGNTALHLAIREPRVKAAVSFFPASDFFLESVYAAVDSVVNLGTPPANPPVAFAAHRVGESYCDGTISLPIARRRLVLYSPAYFASSMGRLQLHHGTVDLEVPYEHSESLNAAMEAVGATAPFYEFFTYEGGEHTFESLPGSEDEARRFFLSVIEPLLFLEAETLRTTGTGDAYRWFLDGTPIPGATDSVLVPSVAGSYRLEFTTTGGCTFSSETYDYLSTGVSGRDVPLAFASEPIRPNPFNPSALFAYRLPEEGTVEIRLVDARGRLVRAWPAERMQAGFHTARIEAGDLASGVYFVEARWEEFATRQKAVLIR